MIRSWGLRRLPNRFGPAGCPETDLTLNTVRVFFSIHVDDLIRVYLANVDLLGYVSQHQKIDELLSPVLGEHLSNCPQPFVIVGQILGRLSVFTICTCPSVAC